MGNRAVKQLGLEKATCTKEFSAEKVIGLVSIQSIDISNRPPLSNSVRLTTQPVTKRLGNSSMRLTVGNWNGEDKRDE